MALKDELFYHIWPSLNCCENSASNEYNFKLVGLAGFEPTTPCPPGRCATRLRYSPFRQRVAKQTGQMRIGKYGKS